MELIKGLDSFGKEFKFNIDGGPLKTFIGGLINLLLMMGTLVCIWYFGKDLYEKKSPVFISEEVILQRAPYINLDYFENEIIFAIQIGTMDSGLIHQSGFYFPVFSVYNKINDTDIEIESEPCVASKFNNDSRMDVSGFYCYSYNRTIGDRLFNINPEILYDEETDNKNRGNYVDHSVVLKFQLSNCTNHFENKYNIKCPTQKDYTDYEKYNPNFLINYFLSSNLINPKDYGKPYRSFFKYYEEIANIKKYYYRNPSYLISQVISDVGFLYETFENKYFLEFNDIFFGETEAAFFDGFNFIFEFNLSPRYKIYRRIYIKLQDLMAQVGGFMSFINYLAQFLYGFYIENYFYVFMIDKLFNLNIIHDKKLTEDNTMNYNQNNNNQIELSIKHKDMQNLEKLEHVANLDPITNVNKNDLTNLDHSDNRIINDINNCNNDHSKGINKVDKSSNNKLLKRTNFINKKNNEIYNKSLKQIIEEKSNINEKMTISQGYRCKYYVCCYDKKVSEYETYKYSDKINIIKYELMKAAEEELEKKLEITELFKVIDQFRLLKKILLNENQCFMLDNREIQNINNKNRKNLQKLGVKEGALAIELNKLKYETKKKNLCKYIAKRKSDGSLTAIDEILLKYMDKGLNQDLAIPEI